MSTPDKPDIDDEKNLRQDIPQDAKVIQVQNVDYAMALSTGPQLKASSPRSIQLFLILLVAFMGSLSNGFDGSGKHFILLGIAMGGIDFILESVMSAVNGME